MVEAVPQPVDYSDIKPVDKFDCDRWLKQLTLMAENPESIDIDLFCYFFQEICYMFKLMSKAMHLAFKDISTKALTIMANRDLHKS